MEVCDYHFHLKLLVSFSGFVRFSRGANSRAGPFLRRFHEHAEPAGLGAFEEGRAASLHADSVSSGPLPPAGIGAGLSRTATLWPALDSTGLSTWSFSRLSTTRSTRTSRSAPSFCSSFVGSTRVLATFAARARHP